MLNEQPPEASRDPRWVVSRAVEEDLVFSSIELDPKPEMEQTARRERSLDQGLRCAHLLQIDLDWSTEVTAERFTLIRMVSSAS